MADQAVKIHILKEVNAASVRPVAKPAVHLRDWTHKVRFDAAFRDATLVARAWIAPPPGR